MNNYNPNSHKSKNGQSPADERKKPTKAIKGVAKTKKKSEVRKFADVFVSEDATQVKDYIFMDILVPAVKKVISEVVTGGIDMILYGKSGGRSNSGSSSSIASKVSYRGYYDRDRTSRSPREVRKTYNYDDVIFETRGEAELVLMQMDEIQSTYGMVKVADLYDLAGITGDYTSNDYGWTNIQSANVVAVRGGGFMIKLPRALPID